MDSNWVRGGAPAGGLHWEGPPDPTTQRAIVDMDQKFRQLWYLEQALEAARSVGLVGFKHSNATATCFLVGPQLILTNHHVFESAADAAEGHVQFGYRELFNGDLTDPPVFDCDPAALFVTNEALDYSLVALAASPGLPYLKLRHGDATELESHIAIIQHPDGAPLQVASRDNSLVWQSAQALQYLTNTEYGSSGAPVFNDYWRVIALHSKRVQDPAVSGREVWYRNQGTRVSAILADPRVSAALPA